MTGPPVDPLADYHPNWKQQSQSGDPLAGYHPDWKQGAPPGNDIHAQYRSGALQKRMSDANARDAANLADAQADDVTAPAVFGGTLANAIKYVPGAEAFTAGVHSLINRQPYRKSLEDVQTAEGMIPKGLRVPLNLAGGVAAQMAVPGSPTVAAGRFGVAQGLLQSNPDATVANRVNDAGKDALLNMATSKAVQGLTTGVRALASKAPEAVQGDLKDITSAASNQNYPVSRQAGNLATVPAVAQQKLANALNDPQIKPLVDRLRNSPLPNFQNATDSDLAHEAYTMLTEHHEAIANKIAQKGEYNPLLALDAKEIEFAKGKLRDALNDVTGGQFEKAVTEHQANASAKTAFDEAYNATPKIANNRLIGAKKLQQQTSGGLQDKLAAMSQGQAQGAQQGILAGLKESLNPTLNPLTGFGVGAQLNRIQPALDAADRQAGLSDIPDFLRRLGVAARP